ncbi:MAG: M48 family metallopeptidase [Hominilimicola sp.]
MIEYEIKRSRRKTLAIQIKSDGKIEVRCDYSVKDAVIRDFVQSKEKWINKHLERIATREKTPLVFGSKALFLGKAYEITASDGQSYFDGERIYINKNTDIYTVLGSFYKASAQKILPDMVHRKEQIMNLYANKIGITSAKTRWGSCSGRNNINFSWRLVMAEPEVIDYVIVHELAHIKEKNHGKRFWKLVEKYKPNYIEKQNKLKQLADRLTTDGWE